MGTNKSGGKVCHSETSQVPVFGENPFKARIYFCRLVISVVKHNNSEIKDVKDSLQNCYVCMNTPLPAVMC